MDLMLKNICLVVWNIFPYIGMILPNIWTNMVDGMSIPNHQPEMFFKQIQFCPVLPVLPFFFRQTWLTPAEGGSLQG
jgi:hypothetical protein